MKKIIKEIIENNPELEKDKDNLEKAVNVLEENNPKILPTNEFKKSLKSRIEGIIGLKQGKKSNFSVFAVPVFSILFIVGGFLYYYDDINFFGDGDDINIYKSEKLTEEEILNIELEQLGELFEDVDSIDNIVDDGNIIQKESKSENNNIKRNIIEGSVNKTIKKIEKNEDISEDDMNEYINEIFSTESTSDKENDGDNLEDSSILEIFESLDMDLNEESESMIYDEGSEGNSIEDSDIIETSFESFCDNEGGELSGTGIIQKCTTNKKECFASEFKNGVCEFVEIK